MRKTVSLMVALALVLLAMAGCQSLPDPSETVTAFFEGVKAYDYEAIAATLGGGTTAEDIQAAIGGELNRALLGPVYERMSYQLGEATIDGDAQTATLPVTVTYPDLGVIFADSYTETLEPLVDRALEGESTSEEEVEQLLIEGVTAGIEAADAPMRSDELVLDLIYAEEDGWGILVGEPLIGVLTGQIQSVFGDMNEAAA